MERPAKRNLFDDDSSDSAAGDNEYKPKES